MAEEKRNLNTLRHIRRLCQFVAFVCFLVLLIFADPLASKGWMVDLFPRMSPLGALSAMLAGATLVSRYLPALVLVLFTLIFGRFFCGWVCPLGTTIDIGDWLLRKSRKKTARIYDGRRFKYYLLAFLLLSAVFGVQMAGWFDPLSIATRSYTVVVHPYLTRLLDASLGILSAVPIVGGVFARVRDALNFALYHITQKTFASHFLFLIIFVAILLMGLFRRRYWCRNICPLGALLALLSGLSWFRRTVSDECIACRKCERDCRMGAIPEPDGDTPAGKMTLEGECILCLDCRALCPVSAISFGRTQPTAQREPVNLQRRGVIASFVASALAVPALKLNIVRKISKQNLNIIRPPGALPEDEFLERCVRCGECMRVCRTNALHPAGLEAGLEGLWTPRLIPRIGHCDYQCTLCGKVCPSGAIQPLTPEKKHTISIGLARFDHDRCIPWVAYARLEYLKENYEDRNCGTCEEVCPVPTKAIRYQHIELPNGKELRLPFVLPELCVGCGYCERVCPVSGLAGVRVEGRRETVEVRMAEEEKVASLEALFPEQAGKWRLKQAPVTYAGRRRLFQYIDGGAEPYLTYSFKQVCAADYKMEKSETVAHIDLWEFGSVEDAYGVFTKDRPTEDTSPLQIGDEGLIYQGYIYAWRDRFFLKAEPREGSPSPDDTKQLAAAILSAIKAPKAEKPGVLSLLPEKMLLRGTELFFHKQLILDNIYLTEEPIEENVFHLSEKTNAVVADYKLEKSEYPFKFMIIEYPDNTTAEKAAKDFIILREKWGESPKQQDGLTISKDSTGLFATLAVKKNFLLGVFRCEDAQVAIELTKAALAKIE